jgi:hypothetical protein
MPWAECNQQFLLFLKSCLKENKKIHCNGFAHFAAYFYLSTLFDKPYYICSKAKITPET